MKWSFFNLPIVDHLLIHFNFVSLKPIKKPFYLPNYIFVRIFYYCTILS